MSDKIYWIFFVCAISFRVSYALQILVGPCVRDSNFESKFYQHNTELDVKCFGGEISHRANGIFYDANEDSYDEIILRLHHQFPKWHPDFVMWWHPEYRTFPWGIERSRYPTVAVVGDWNIQFHSLRLNLQRFDIVVTDTQGVEVLRSTGLKHVHQWLQYSFHPIEHQPRLADTPYQFDVLYVGSLNEVLQSGMLFYC